MQKRRALLIGVPRYHSDAISELSFIIDDVKKLQGALESSGYHVTSIGLDEPASRSIIRGQINRFCTRADKDEDLLIYFSGHGFHYNGCDYIVPYDAAIDDHIRIEEYLLNVDLNEIFDNSDARCILFFIDACREGIELGTQSVLSIKNWSKGKIIDSKNRNVVYIFACESGEVCRFVNDDKDRFSLFSRALSEIIHADYPSTILRDILKDTQERLNELADQHGKPRQKIRCRFETGIEDGNIFDKDLFEGPNKDEINLGIVDIWHNAVIFSSLWSIDSVANSNSVGDLKQRVGIIVSECRKQWLAAYKSLPQDAWRDEMYPVRIAERIAFLTSLCKSSIKISAAETALLLVVPFVREAILSATIARNLDMNPLSLNGTGTTFGLRSDLERLHQKMPQLIRKAERLKENGSNEDHDVIAIWLMHRCILRTPEVWMEQAKGGYIPDDLLKALSNNSQKTFESSTDPLTNDRIMELTRCIQKSPEYIERVDRPGALKSFITIGVGTTFEQHIREKMLAYLLILSCWMAIDIRMLSEVLVDHIGLSDPVRLEDVFSTVSNSTWVPDARGRSLRAECRHPAVDLALREHVDRGNVILESIWQKIQKKEDHLDVLEDLPLRLTGQDIVPEKGELGSPVYETPHLRFQLSHNEIRELLMGEQLYGDPTLAIRELYQNALDACRYRLTRISYLKQIGEHNGLEWEGHIVFRQGVEDGRPFIECEDNGIGMGKNELEDAFSHAGRRFVDMPEFIEEQAEWLRCNPPLRLYPNSQFGIGVFSYFMLADELLIETTRLDRKGKPGNTLEVLISGSGSLFRVKILNKEKDAGSRIRLYLNKIDYKTHQGKLDPISCLDILKGLLFVAQFKTDVMENDTLKATWKAGLIRSESNIKTSKNPDVWWVKSDSITKNYGRLLADGIVARFGKFDENMNCAIVNLNQAHRPKLTVDRRLIVEWDKDYVINILRENIHVLIDDPDWLNFEWLWNLEGRDPIAAQLVIDGLLSRNKEVLLKLNEFSNIRLSLDEFGCFSPDRLIVMMIGGYEVNQYDDNQRKLEKISEKISVLEKNIAHLDRVIKIESNFVNNVVSSKRLNETFLKKEELFNLKSERSGYESSIAAIKGIMMEKFEKGYPIYFLNYRVKLLIKYGLKLPDWLNDEIETLKEGQRMPKIHAGDYIALSNNLSGIGPWIEHKVSALHIFMCSKTLNEPLAESLKRFWRLSSIGFSVPLVDLLQLSGISMGKKDEILLSINLDGKAPWLDEEVSIIHILRSSQRLNESIGAILRQLHRFDLFGLVIPEASPDKFDDIYITENDLTPFRRIINAKSWDFIADNNISAFRLINSAKEMNESIGTLLRFLQRLVPLGLVVPGADPNDFDFMTVKHEGLADFVALSFENRVSSGKIIKLIKNLRLMGPVERTV